MNTRARLCVAGSDRLKYLQQLRAVYLESDECILERQQLEDVAGAQLARGDLVLSQAAGVGDGERDGLAEPGFCLRADAVSYKVAERACAGAVLLERAIEFADDEAQRLYFFTVRSEHLFNRRVVRDGGVDGCLFRADARLCRRRCWDCGFGRCWSRRTRFDHRLGKRRRDEHSQCEYEKQYAKCNHR